MLHRYFPLWLIISGSVSLVLSIPVRAQNVDDDLPPPPPVVARRAVVAERNAPEVSIAGQVLRTKQVDNRVTNEKMLVAQLDLGNDRRAIVDLGPTRIYKQDPIYSGDQIAVFGPEVRLGNAVVVLATEVRVGGETVVVPRTAAAPTAGYVVTEPQIKIYGRVEALRPARLRDSRSEHLIARIVDRNGGVTIVDLGPPAALWQADLRSGEWVTIYGQQMQVNERPVILARELNKAGTPFLIERELAADPAAAGAVVAQAVVAP